LGFEDSSCQLMNILKLFDEPRIPNVLKIFTPRMEFTKGALFSGSNLSLSHPFFLFFFVEVEKIQ
jgi:hypothetical protein